MGRLFHLMARRHQQHLKPFRLRGVQAHVLAVLWLEGPKTVGELQTALALGSSTMTGALDRMQAAGLIERGRSPDDARAVVIRATAWPAKRREELYAALFSAEEACFATLTKPERRELKRLLDKAAAGLSEDDDGE